MSKIVNIHEAKTNLSRIVEEVAAGAEVIIAKAGKPMAKLTPLTPVVKPIKFGLMAGKFEVPDDFNTMMADEIRAMFEGDDENSR
jgi:prevent-host-death family protein